MGRCRTKRRGRELETCFEDNDENHDNDDNDENHVFNDNDEKVREQSMVLAEG